MCKNMPNPKANACKRCSCYFLNVVKQAFFLRLKDLPPGTVPSWIYTKYVFLEHSLFSKRYFSKCLNKDVYAHIFYALNFDPYLFKWPIWNYITSTSNINPIFKKIRKFILWKCSSKGILFYREQSGQHILIVQIM